MPIPRVVASHIPMLPPMMVSLVLALLNSIAPGHARRATDPQANTAPVSEAARTPIVSGTVVIDRSGGLSEAFVRRFRIGVMLRCGNEAATPVSVDRETRRFEVPRSRRRDCVLQAEATWGHILFASRPEELSPGSDTPVTLTLFFANAD
jgi:hypothetical protein